MPIHMPQCAGKSYRPSNGTEGEIFQERFCYRCIHEDLENEDYCEIVSLTMAYYTNHEKYPKEWVFDKDGYPTCTKFEKEE